ncbi:hypothetical protein MKZ38_008179 [Zalerion maritima]|uniref:Uncharacterized protein n=1 Tax=Zalerion maritima TaxID=339359 RepID=A0AAD5RW36_9PEZI|nr:hypothetical protein MKZ38_008179 [Zalerion maritima]
MSLISDSTTPRRYSEHCDRQDAFRSGFDQTLLQNFPFPLQNPVKNGQILASFSQRQTTLAIATARGLPSSAVPSTTRTFYFYIFFRPSPTSPVAESFELTNQQYKYEFQAFDNSILEYPHTETSRATFIIADDHHLGSPGTKKPWRYGSPPQVGDKDACGNRENELGRQGHPNCLAPGVDESDTDGNGRNISLDESTIVEEDLPPPRISTTSHGGDVKPFRGNSNGLEDLGTAKTPPPRPTTSGEPVNAGDSMPVEEAWNAEEYERRDGEGFDWDLVADEINDASDEGWQEFDENWQPPPGFSNLGCPFGPIPKRRLRWSAFYEATLDTIWEDPMEPSTNTSPMSSTATLVNSSGSYSNETSI